MTNLKRVLQKQLNRSFQSYCEILQPNIEKLQNVQSQQDKCLRHSLLPILSRVHPQQLTFPYWLKQLFFSLLLLALSALIQHNQLMRLKLYQLHLIQQLGKELQVRRKHEYLHQLMPFLLFHKVIHQ